MTRADLLEHIRRLNGFYRRRASDADLEQQVRELSRRLAGFDALTVRRAVDRVIDDEPHYPTPGKLAAACAELAQRATTRTATRPDLDRCRFCCTAVIERTWSQFDRRAQQWVIRSRDLCDCQWRAALRYRSEEELDAMGGQADPFVAAELHRRATPTNAGAR